MKINDNTGIIRDLLKIAQCAGFAASLFGASMLVSTAAQAELRSGFNANTLTANDDDSTDLVDLGFTLNFFGTDFNQTYVNNNGNITFDGPMGTYTPFTITNNTQKIIAPFFADVDTRVTGSNPVTYGSGTVGSRPAFGVNWINVACFATPDGGYNTFQLVLIDRSDIGAGDFDIEFNYNQIVWEAGTASGGNSVCQQGTPARVGYSSGTGVAGGSFELAGSGIAGYFLDKLADGTDNPTGLIYNNRNSLVPGRYVFEVRNGSAPLGYGISGIIYGNDNTNPLASSLVQVCNVPDASHPDTHCSLTTSNANGEYNIGGISDGEYTIKAFPPEGTFYQTASINATLAGAPLTNQNIILVGPQPLPAGTSVSPNLNINQAGEVMVYWNSPLLLTTRGCSGGSASYQITRDDDGTQLRAGGMTESAANPGVYTANIAALYPNSGHVTVSMTIHCPDNSTSITEFSMYIDPSGVVKDIHGNPVKDATVTLSRSDSLAGPFNNVLNGSSIMSPTNRTNPDTTNVQGLFGWDVVAGYYKVRAEKQGCTAPGSNQSYVETDALTIPPPVTDIQLVLDCGTPVYAVCDVNQNGSISKADISIINSRLRQTVSVGTQGDVNRDGKITTLDTRGCTLQCTLPGCAEPTAP